MQRIALFGLRIMPLVTSNGAAAMSALGQKRTLGRLYTMSALPPKADIAERDRDVRFVAIADIGVVSSSTKNPSGAARFLIREAERSVPMNLLFKPKRHRDVCG
jgi:hypothetical protein